MGASEVASLSKNTAKNLLKSEALCSQKVHIYIRLRIRVCYLQRLLSSTMYDHSSQQSFCPAVVQSKMESDNHQIANGQYKDCLDG